MCPAVPGLCQAPRRARKLQESRGVGAFTENIPPIVALPPEGAYRSLLPEVWGYSGFLMAFLLPQGQLPSALCAGTERERLVSRGDPAWPPKVRRSSIHWLSTSCLLITCPVLTLGTWMGGGRVSGCSQNSQQGIINPDAMGRLGWLGPRALSGVSCGESGGLCRQWR